MPKPLYILCSQSGSEDKLTGLMSHFSVLEQIEVRPPQPALDGAIHIVGSVNMQVVSSVDFQVVAMWRKTSMDDPEQPFQFILSLFLPPNNEVLELLNGTFMFEKPRFRATAIVQGLILRSPGILRAECRVRKLDDNDDAWIVQEFDVDVMEVKSDPSSL